MKRGSEIVFVYIFERKEKEGGEKSAKKFVFVRICSGNNSCEQLCEQKCTLLHFVCSSEKHVCEYHFNLNIPIRKYDCQVIQYRIQTLLQLLEDIGGILFQLFATHRLKHFLQLHTQLLHIIHENAGDPFVRHMLGKLFFHNVSICNQYLDNCFGESSHVPFPDFRIGTLKLTDYIEALC